MSVSYYGASDEDGDPDIVYYNGLIINNRANITTSRDDPPAKFNETRVQPIIKDASKYNFSIVRANLNGSGKVLPMFIPSIRIGPLDNPTQNVNLTIYSITLQIAINYTLVGAGFPVVQTFTSTQPIIWTPEILDTNLAPVPLASSTQTFQDVNTQYYWCSTYSHWLSLVNQAFNAALASIQSQFAAAYVAAGNPAPAPTLQTRVPFLTYNPSNNLFSLYVPRAGFGALSAQGSLTPPTSAAPYSETATLWFNNNMNGLITNFKTFYDNIPATEQDYRISPVNAFFQNILSATSPPVPAIVQPAAPGGNPAFPTPPLAYWILVQDYPSTSSLWSPVESIVFTTTMLPLAYEQTGNPVRYGDSTTGETGNTESAFQPIITDISLTNESASDYRQFIQYIPSAEYRLASFTRSRTPIQNIDIQVFWKNRLDGNLYPVYMYNGASVSVKCMFRRRGVYDYPHPVKGYD
jgi:hypothetical protein